MGLGSPITCLLLLCIWQRSTSMTESIPYRGRYYDMKCLDKETGRELMVGETLTRHGLCVRVQCLGNLQLWEDSCQVPKLEGECTELPAANEYLDYPHCCPLYECKRYTKDSDGQCEETKIYDQYGSLRKTSITQILVVRDLLPGKTTEIPPKRQFDI